MVRRNRIRCRRKEILGSTGALRREHHFESETACHRRPDRGRSPWPLALAKDCAYPWERHLRRDRVSNLGLRVINGRIAAGRRLYVHLRQA